MHSGQRLRSLRQQHRLTQGQLAEKLGVTEFTVCRYENGQITMPIEAIKRAAAVFGACPAYFLDESGCQLGQDQELIEVFRWVDRLDQAKRDVVIRTLRALLTSMAENDGTADASTAKAPKAKPGPKPKP